MKTSSFFGQQKDLAPREEGIVGTPSSTVLGSIEGELAKGPNISIIRLVELLVQTASNARASDIHLDPRSEGVQVRIRVDGVLQDECLLPHVIHNEVISRLKILCGMRTDEHQAAQDGRFKMQLDNNKSVDVRVSIVPTYHGENAVMRLLADQSEEFTLETLGFTKENQEKILHARYGSRTV